MYIYGTIFFEIIYPNYFLNLFIIPSQEKWLPNCGNWLQVELNELLTLGPEFLSRSSTIRL